MTTEVLVRPPQQSPRQPDTSEELPKLDDELRLELERIRGALGNTALLRSCDKYTAYRSSTELMEAAFKDRYDPSHILTCDVVYCSPDSSYWLAYALAQDPHRTDPTELIISAADGQPAAIIEREPTIDNRLSPENRYNIPTLLHHYDLAIDQDRTRLVAPGDIALSTNLQKPDTENHGGTVHLRVPESVNLFELTATLRDWGLHVRHDNETRELQFSVTDIEYPVAISLTSPTTDRHTMLTGIENPRMLLAHVEQLIRSMHHDHSQSTVRKRPIDKFATQRHTQNRT